MRFRKQKDLRAYPFFFVTRMWCPAYLTLVPISRKRMHVWSLQRLNALRMRCFSRPALENRR